MMTEQQHERWKLLSLGLAQTYKSLTPQRREKLLRAVEGCLDWIVGSHELSEIRDWDGNEGSAYVCDDLSDYMWEYRYEMERGGEIHRGRFGDMLSACVRAGFDVAVSPSLGVIGFTAGDLRDACGGETPDWVVGFFGDQAASFLTAPRDASVWL